jgi:hypothetical protein
MSSSINIREFIRVALAGHGGIQYYNIEMLSCYVQLY